MKRFPMSRTQGSKATHLRDEKELASKLGLRLVPGTNTAVLIGQSLPATSPSICPSLGQMTLGQLIQKGHGQWAQIEAAEKHVTAGRGLADARDFGLEMALSADWGKRWDRPSA